jgi:hypothetical protein
MSTKYVVHRYAAQIDAYECTKETASFVWLTGVHSGNEPTKKKRDCDVFDTWEAAHAELTRRAEVSLNAARRELQLAQGFAGNVRGMKPPQGKEDSQP